MRNRPYKNEKFHHVTLLSFKILENFVLKIVHCGHNLGAHMNKIGWMGPGSRFFWEKKLKKCPDQKMTKGKIVLELVKYAKSAVRKFWPIRGLHCGHVTLNLIVLEGFPWKNWGVRCWAANELNYCPTYVTFNLDRFRITVWNFSIAFFKLGSCNSPLGQLQPGCTSSRIEYQPWNTKSAQI